MSKVPLRARALDAAKPMPVYSPDELPDLSDYAACNRIISALPTGVDKEEEMELHLQQALSAQQATSTGQDASEDAYIPVPEVSDCQTVLDTCYTADYIPPKLLIKVQAALNLEPEIPDYDMDKSDEEFLAKLRASEIDVTELQFETVIDRLEKNTDHTVTSFDEAKAILTDFDDDIISSVYDYWLGKRVEARQALIPRIKTERRDGTTVLSPYVAFRRRAERMQTRKNRKNDEDSYEKILRLSQDLRKAVTLLEMVKRREKTKRELLSLDVEVLERRYRLEDWDSLSYSAILRDAKPSHSFSFGVPAPPREPKAPRPKKAKRVTQRPDVVAAATDKGLVSREWLQQNLDDWNRPFSVPGSPVRNKRKTATQPDADGKFTFRRILGCVYYAPATMGQIKRPKPGSRLQPHPVPLESDAEKRRQDHCYESRHSPPATERLHDLFLRSFSGGLRHIGQARARRGRGGRLVFDRSLDEQQPRAWLPSNQRSATASSSLPTSASSSSLLHSPPPTGLSSSSSSHAPPHRHLFRPCSPLNSDSPGLDSISRPSSPPALCCPPDSSPGPSTLRRLPPVWNAVAGSRTTETSDSEESSEAAEGAPRILVERQGSVHSLRVSSGVCPAGYSSHRAQLHLQKVEPRLTPPSELAGRAPPPHPLSKQDACLATSAVMNIQSVMKLVSQREPLLNNNKMDGSEGGSSSGNSNSSESSRSWNGDRRTNGGENGSAWRETELGSGPPAVLQLNYAPGHHQTSSTQPPPRSHPLPTPSPSPTHSTPTDGDVPTALPAAMKTEASGERAKPNQASPSLAISPPDSIATASLGGPANGEMDSQAFHQIQRPIVR